MLNTNLDCIKEYQKEMKVDQRAAKEILAGNEEVRRVGLDLQSISNNLSLDTSTCVPMFLLTKTGALLQALGEPNEKEAFERCTKLLYTLFDLAVTLDWPIYSALSALQVEYSTSTPKSKSEGVEIRKADFFKILELHREKDGTYKPSQTNNFVETMRQSFKEIYNKHHIDELTPAGQKTVKKVVSLLMWSAEAEEKIMKNVNETVKEFENEWD